MTIGFAKRRALVVLFAAALIYSRSARADGFSATASVNTCEMQGGGFPSGLFNCSGIGGTLLSSLTAEASETFFGSNGKTTVTGIAAMNGPTLSATPRILIPGNGVSAGNNTFSAGVDAEWNDTLTNTGTRDR